jgi:hypothetical protein
MGALFSGPPKAPVIPVQPPAAHPATLANSTTDTAMMNQKRAAAAAEGMGMDNTIATSPQGAAAPSTAKATLLGD